MATPTSEDQRTVEARAAFTASLNSVGSHVESDLQYRTKDIQANSASLAKQEAEVAKQTVALSKQSDAYQKIADDSRGRLKEIGDIQNWAEMIERDLLVVEETLRLAEEDDESMEQDRTGKRTPRRWF
ncbi:hypothetical protein MMC09_003878 [Bachmanniomyces sp. S44760]|nr:hypothetical protein [Bachmanniomyces sp. S44760]